MYLCLSTISVERLFLKCNWGACLISWEKQLTCRGQCTLSHPLPLLFRFGSCTVFLSCSGVLKISLNFRFSENCVIPASSAFMYLAQGSTDHVRKLLAPHILLNKPKCETGCLQHTRVFVRWYRTFFFCSNRGEKINTGHERLRSVWKVTQRYLSLVVQRMGLGNTMM